MTAQIPFDRSLKVPFHRQIYEGYREAILGGRLRPRDRLPSTRQLADELGISRTPVFEAFERLRYEGFVEGRPGAGTFVAVRPLKAPARGGNPTTDLPLPGDRWLTEAIGEPRVRLRPFHRSVPALDRFPVQLWGQLVRRHAGRFADESERRGDPAGLTHLREQAAQHLRTMRFVNCDPEQVFIVSGSRMALQMCALALLEPNDTVGVEACTRLSALHGLTALRVPVELIPPEEAGSEDVPRNGFSGRIGFAYVTPSHRYLFGPPMSDRYRQQLLRWARANRTWILEEDYDGDLRHDGGRPVPIHSEGPDRVIYLLTFVRSMFPGLKTHFLVVPPSTVQTFVRVRRAVLGTTLLSHQSALADFIRDGHFARHVRRMRPIYSERRDALLASLRRHGGDVLTPHRVDAGIDLAATLTVDVPDQDVARIASKQGLSTVALSHFYPDRNGLILGFGCSTPQQLDDAAHTLLDIIRSSHPTIAHRVAAAVPHRPATS